MATSTIHKTEAFTNIERITSFPYTAPHSGIAQVLIVKGASGDGWVMRSVNIAGDNGQNINIRGALFNSFDGETATFPVIKGVTYTVTAGSEWLALSDLRSCLVY
jgi:hypothetical protein